MGSVIQECIYAYFLGCIQYTLFHFRKGNVVVLHGEGNVFTHSKTYELPIRVLEHCSCNLGEGKDIKIFETLSLDYQFPCCFSAVGSGDKAVKTVEEG